MASRTTAQTEHRYGLVQDMVLKNFNPEQIRQGLERRGITMSMNGVRNYIGKVRVDMRNQRSLQLEQRIDLELSVLEMVRRKAMESYERSLEPAITSETVEETNAPGALPNNQQIPAGLQVLQDLLGGDNQPVANRRVRKEKMVGQSGDPRFLETVLHASQDIRKLLGIDPEEVRRIELRANISVGESPEELRAMDPHELARLVAEEIAKG